MASATKALAAAKALVANDAASPLAAQAYQLAGQIHTANERLDEAIAAYEQVLKLEARPLAADLALARLHQVARRREQSGDLCAAGPRHRSAQPGCPEPTDSQSRRVWKRRQGQKRSGVVAKGISQFAHRCEPHGVRAPCRKALDRRERHTPRPFNSRRMIWRRWTASFRSIWPPGASRMRRR